MIDDICIVCQVVSIKNELFSYSMIPNGSGKAGDNKNFKHQVLEKFQNENEKVLESLEDLSFADEDKIEEILRLLEDNE